MVGDNLKTLYAKLPSAVKLVAVSKFHPVSRLMEAYDAGQRVFGENRPQELAQKVPQMPSDVEWHFIGHLQTNKLKLVLPYVSLVQSVDSLHLLEAIDKWGRENGKTIDVLLELHLGAEETKHGFSEEEIVAIVNIAGEGVRPETVAARPLPPQAAGPSLLCGRGWPQVSETTPSSSGQSPSNYWYFRVSADRFLRNMVRAIVGTLIEVGRGKQDPAWVKELIETGTRGDAGESVPGHALFLSKVKY